jgi:hypothetical protein
MATQQAGLFTQGPSVEDLLQQRNTRATNLQQQLMAQAAQGSRTPAKARAFSLLGSSLGRALSGAVGGGQDQQLAEIRAKQAAQKALQQEALAVSSGTIAEKRAFINKIAPIYPAYAQDLNERVNEQQAAEAKKLADEKASKTALALEATKYATTQAQKQAALDLKAQQKLEDDLTSRAESEARIMGEEEAALASNIEKEANKELADSIRKDNGRLADLVEAGNPAAISAAVKMVADTDSDTDKVFTKTYWAVDGEGEEIRVGEDNDGNLFELTADGVVPLNRPIQRTTDKTVVLDTPLQIARASYDTMASSQVIQKSDTIFSKVTLAQEALANVKSGQVKSIPLLIRTASEIFNGDSKAVTEIAALKDANTFLGGLMDGLTTGTLGTLSPETITQLEKIIKAGERGATRNTARVVSREYRRTLSSVEDPSQLQSQLLSFFPSASVMGKVKDHEAYPEGSVQDNEEGEVFTVVAGHFLKL